MTFGMPQWTPETAAAAVAEHGSIRAAARNLNCGETALRKWYNRAVKAGIAPKLFAGQPPREDLKQEYDKRQNIIPDGRVESIHAKKMAVPKRGVKRYLFTSAQNNTKLFEPFWVTLTKLADHYSAEIHVARYFYIKQGLGASGDKADIVSKKDTSSFDDFWWDPRIVEFLSDYRLEVAPGLVWCGETNTLPTAVNPLSGMEVYTGRDSGLFPHPKIMMQSIASTKYDPTKFNYTTGTITQRNYIQRKAGLKAEFHHCYGALLVEVDSEGSWWVRQINADSKGTIHDLDILVDYDVETKQAVLSDGHSIEAITEGDAHFDEIDPVVEQCTWTNEDSIVNMLRPRYQFMHDALNFGRRNHHNRGDAFRQLEQHVSGRESVRDEVALTMMKICEYAEVARAARPDAETIVVDSNHDRAAIRWLKETDWKSDPINMQFYLESALAKVNAIVNNDKKFHMMRHWATEYSVDYPWIKFLDEDESFIICEDAHGGIECGMHGHLGPNGSRGTINGFKKMGRKANIGHSHSAGIVDGIYQAGTSSVLDMGYNIGPGSWSHSHIITYPNGKRAIITIWKGKWRA